MLRQPTNLRVPVRHILLLGALALASGWLASHAAATVVGRRGPHQPRHVRIRHARCAAAHSQRLAHRASRACPKGQRKPRSGTRKRRRASTRTSSLPGTTSRPALLGPLSIGSTGSPNAATTVGASSGGGAPESEPELAGGLQGDATTDPIDPRFLTELPFGTRSFWIQPWRAYLDTWPASRLTESLGINFDVSTADAESAAQLLQDSGFKLARIGINWEALSYENPTEFSAEAHIRNRLIALQKHGLRPLILLDANSTGPAPAKTITLTTVSAAQAGAQTVTLTAASAAQVIPGKTGFDELSFGGNPDILITSVGPDGQAALSKPLPQSLAAGEHKGATLLYAPFARPTLPNGEPNPVFQETLAGWLSYVATVCRQAASIFGPEGYDLEVWNELSFDSQFLNSENYYTSSGETGTETEAGVEPGEGPEDEAGLEAEDPEAEEALQAPEGTPALSKAQVTKEIVKVLLDETVAYVRDPAHGIGSGVGITDGFADQTPFPSGANAPVGLTALSKHLYNSEKSFPSAYREGPIHPINALGLRDTLPKSFQPLFIPSYQSLFPEYYLTSTSTETIVRDLAPITTEVYGFPHGRNVGPVGGTPLQKWMTEYNLSPAKATVFGPDGVTPESSVKLTSADKEHFQAKALLRSLVAMVGKGMSREYFFHAGPGALSLISEGFTSALTAHPNTYPGDALGGETMTGFHNMLSQFQGPGPTGPTRQLKLLSITQNGDHSQFTGDGTTAHPNLYDREVLAVLPFQSSPTRFVIPIYVMTHNLLTLYEPNDPTTNIDRFDLPNETFHITLGNLPETTTPPTITAYDPLHNNTTPAHLTKHTNNTAEIEIAATDYPRILTIDYSGE